MTTVAEEDVLTAAELELTVDPIADDLEAAVDLTLTGPAAAAIDGSFIRVEKGAPTDIELAALVCVLTAAASNGAPAGPAGPTDAWGRPTLMHRGTSPFSPYAFPELSHLRD